MVDGNRLDTSVFPPLALNREGGGMQSRVIVSGEPLLFNDVAEVVTERPDGSYYDVDREGKVAEAAGDGASRGRRAAMMVPVKHEARVVGVVQVMSNTAEYSHEQLELVDGLVQQMAAAVRNARLQKEQRRLAAAEAAARAVAAEREQAANVLDAVGDGIFLVDADGIVRLWNRAAALVTGRRRRRRVRRARDAIFPEWDALVARIPVAEHGAAARGATLPRARRHARPLALVRRGAQRRTGSCTRSATSRASAGSRRRRATSSPRSRTSCGRRWPPSTAPRRRS